MDYSTLEKEFAYLKNKMYSAYQKIKKTQKESSSNHVERINANLAYPLQVQDYKQLGEGNGHELGYKTTRLNSSTALTLNAFTTIRQQKSLTIKGISTFYKYTLEKKLDVLKQSKYPANIDIVLENETHVVYIESKYIEMFNAFINFPTIKDVPASYLKKECYPDEQIYKAVRGLFQGCDYYDNHQIIKHAIAIYADCLADPAKYIGKQVILMNLVWELNNYHHRLEKLYYMQIKALQELSTFGFKLNKVMKTCFQKIGIDFTFIYMNYQDFITYYSDIQTKDSILFNYLKQRYCFIKPHARTDIKRLVYMLSLMNIEHSEQDCNEILNQKEVVAMEEFFGGKEISLNDAYLNESDAILAVGNNLEGVPRFKIEKQSLDYLIINTAIHFNKYWIIYLKIHPSIKPGFISIDKREVNLQKLYYYHPEPYYGELDGWEVN